MTSSTYLYHQTNLQPTLCYDCIPPVYSSHGYNLHTPYTCDYRYVLLGPQPQEKRRRCDSSNRQTRNAAEKQRRDRLNFYINQLSTLVPIISFSPKKLDKTSILRLAATYIRLHKVIFGSVKRDGRNTAQKQMLEYLPQYLASFNWSENVLHEMDGMLLIVNGAGRIIFISHTVEKLLGHTQIELMGQSLYNLTCLEDFEELKKNLAPDNDPNSTVVSDETSGDGSSSDSMSQPATPPSRVSSVRHSTDSEMNTSSDEQQQRRSFYVRLKQRAQSRGDQPQYVLVHVVGHLRSTLPRNQSSTSLTTKQLPNNNDIILVAVVEPFQEKRITTLSLLEASREEFITRHTLDGRIIYTDHRISIVAGYLSEEVCGNSAFQYMHKADFRWTMVGLRQMYFRGSNYGQSCYRLKSKNGDFIYLKTCGYLELSESNDSFQSLICINSLVSATEGEELMSRMKERCSPVIKSKDDASIENLACNLITEGKCIMSGETEDPKVVEVAVSQMISNVSPSPSLSSLGSPCPAPFEPLDVEFAKATEVSKALPPLSVQVKKIGIVPPIIKTPASLAAALSPPSSHRHSHHSPPLKHSPPPPQHLPPQQNRPTVIRMKVKRIKTEKSGQGQEVVTISPQSVMMSPTSHSPGRSPGIVLGKRKSSEDSDWSMSSVSPTPSVTTTTPLTPYTPKTPLHTSMVESPTQFHLENVDSFFTGVDVDDTDILNCRKMQDDDVSMHSLAGNLEDIPDMYSLMWGEGEMPGGGELPEVLETSHRTLDSRMAVQGEQIQEIQQELNLVSTEHTNGQSYNNKLNQLQMQKMSKFLQDFYQKMDSLQKILQGP